MLKGVKMSFCPFAALYSLEARAKSQRLVLAPCEFCPVLMSLKVL